MQVCTVSVNLAGKADHQVMGKVVTVPEIQILQALHGVTGVLDIVPVNEVVRTPTEEGERLNLLYGEEAFKKVFPGAFPKLPVTLQEIGMDLQHQATSLREKAAKLMADAAKLDNANAGTLVADPKGVAAPKTLDDIFGEAKAA